MSYYKYYYDKSGRVICRQTEFGTNTVHRYLANKFESDSTIHLDYVVKKRYLRPIKHAPKGPYYIDTQRIYDIDLSRLAKQPNITILR